MIETAKAAFPLAYDGAVIFLSWGGERSREVTSTLAEVLKPRFPAAEVFISSTSIDPGDDPMRRILDESLLRCQALIATLTDEAARRPWVIWETAAALITLR